MKSWPHTCINLNRTAAFAAMALLLGSILCSLCFGAVALSPAAFWRALCGESSTAGTILWQVRFPRTLATLLAGSALAVAGAILQTVLHNPLASPGIIGVNAGAGLGVVLCLVLFPGVSGAAAPAAFLGALAAALLVWGIARKTGASRTTIILAGIAINSMANAAIDTVTTLVPDTLPGLNSFKVGSVAGAALKSITPAGALILVCLVLTVLFAGRLDILALGDETARSLGLAAARWRFIYLVLACCLAGAAVSFAGLLGFVGLLVPHIVRPFVKGEARLLLPWCAVFGAAFLTLCDVLARSVFSPFEIPVGILLALLGAPFFLYLLVRRKRHDNT